MDKKYDLCAIGNAIVDIVIEVEDSFLTNNKIPKGQMSLIDNDKSKIILEQFDDSNMKLICGGSAANSLNLAARLGANCFFQGMLASDTAGDYFIKDLHNNKIGTQVDVYQRVNCSSGKCIVMVTPDGQRTMCTNLGIAAKMSPNVLYLPAIENSNYLYIEGYMVSSESCFNTVKKAINTAKKNETKIALTFSDPSMPLYFKKQLRLILNKKIDVLFCNEDEAKGFTEKNDIDDAIKELKKYANIVLVTLGDKGAIAVNNKNKYSIKGKNVKCIDTNGAGDAFAGSFMHGITKKIHIQENIKNANNHASKVVSQWGARLEKV